MSLSRRLAFVAAIPVMGLAVWGGYTLFKSSKVLLEDETLVNAQVKEEPKTELPPAGKSDLVTFGGTPARNMVNTIDKGITLPFSPEKDLKWKATLGSRAYGGPTISRGQIYVGTNNDNPRNPRDVAKPAPGEATGPALDKGILMCFGEKKGDFLWQSVSNKLESGQVNDWPHEGVCSMAATEDDRVYFTTNRCELVCVDMHGMANGNQGFDKETFATKTDADVIWRLDMMKDLKVFPHNMTAASPLIVGDLIFVVTANGVDENHINIPFPEAPSFIAVEKKTGKVKWQSNLPGKNIMHGQWANPAYGVIKGKGQVIFPGGDGWLYSFEPDTGKLIWKFDANPKDSKYDLGGKGTKSDFIGTPVIYNDKVYIGTGQDPEHFEGIGHFWCIDPTKEGDVSPDLVVEKKEDNVKTKANPNSAVVWHYGGNEKRPFARREYVFGRTMSTACIVDDIIYIAELAGYLHCIDAKTGKKYWQFDLKSGIWGSAYFVDGKVMIGNEEGDLFVFKHDPKPEVLDEVEEGSKAGIAAEAKAKADGKDETDAKKAGEKAANLKIKSDVQKKVAAKYLLEKIEIGEPIRSTPVVANGVVYVMTEKTLFAFGKK